ncbi:glutamate decarboxylase gad1, partial [Linderina pennispora]
SVGDSSMNHAFNYGLPVCAFSFTDKFKADHPMADQDVVSTLLRVRGWIIPNYPLPPDKSDVHVLRVVVKEATSEDMINRLVRDVMWATQKMLEAKSQNLADVLSHPLPQNTSTSDLANRIVQSGKGELKEEDQSAHWENLLSKIGVGIDCTENAVPEKRLVDGGRRKTVYEKAC